MSETPLPEEGSLESFKAMKEELLAALAEEGDGAYPWEPGEPETEAYFTQLEADFSLLDGLNRREIDSKADTFLTYLHRSWEAAGNGEEVG